MSNPLEKALTQARQTRGWDKAPAKAEAEENPGKSFRVKCVNYGAVHRRAEDDLEPWETDEETSQTDGDPDESLDGDDSDDTDDDGEELDPDAKSKLVAKILARKNKRYFSAGGRTLWRRKARHCHASLSTGTPSKT